uniref:Uncharacterized protein n=1 Tax=Anguilla anguilla TaxID=7936 RepID=A0A0E9WEN4_ANGAN
MSCQQICCTSLQVYTPHLKNEQKFAWMCCLNLFFLVCALFFILSVCSKQTLKVYLTYSDYALSHV